MDHVNELDSAIRILLRVLSIDERHMSPTQLSGRLGLLDTETIALIHEQPGVQARQLIEQLGIRPTTMQSVIDRLVKRSLVVRDAKQLKGRSIALSLTEEGKALCHSLHQQNLRNCAMMLSVLEEAERGSFVDQIVRIADAAKTEQST